MITESLTTRVRSSHPKLSQFTHFINNISFSSQKLTEFKNGTGRIKACSFIILLTPFSLSIACLLPLIAKIELDITYYYSRYISSSHKDLNMTLQFYDHNLNLQSFDFSAMLLVQLLMLLMHHRDYLIGSKSWTCKKSSS